MRACHVSRFVVIVTAKVEQESFFFQGFHSFGIILSEAKEVTGVGDCILLKKSVVCHAQDLCNAVKVGGVSGEASDHTDGDGDDVSQESVKVESGGGVHLLQFTDV